MKRLIIIFGLSVILIIGGCIYIPAPMAAASQREELLEKEPPEEQQESGKEKNVACLQVPQKIDITLDPLEINGKGQIYSEQYVIKNVKDTAGVLCLSELVCNAGEGSGVIIKTDKQELHDADKKFVYVKIVFGNGDTLVLSPEGNRYEIWMEAGEELTFSYSGEINENADESWKEHDIRVSMRYSWTSENEDFEDADKIEDEIEGKAEDEIEDDAEDEIEGKAEDEIEGKTEDEIEDDAEEDIGDGIEKEIKESVVESSEEADLED